MFAEIKADKTEKWSILLTWKNIEIVTASAVFCKGLK